MAPRRLARKAVGNERVEAVDDAHRLEQRTPSPSFSSLAAHIGDPRHRPPIPARCLHTTCTAPYGRQAGVPHGPRRFILRTSVGTPVDPRCRPRGARAGRRQHVGLSTSAMTTLSPLCASVGRAPGPPAGSTREQRHAAGRMCCIQSEPTGTGRRSVGGRMSILQSAGTAPTTSPVWMLLRIGQAHVAARADRQSRPVSKRDFAG